MKHVDFVIGSDRHSKAMGELDSITATEGWKQELVIAAAAILKDVVLDGLAGTSCSRPDAGENSTPERAACITSGPHDLDALPPCRFIGTILPQVSIDDGIENGTDVTIHKRVGNYGGFRAQDADEAAFLSIAALRGALLVRHLKMPDLKFGSKNIEGAADNACDILFNRFLLLVGLLIGVGANLQCMVGNIEGEGGCGVVVSLLFPSHAGAGLDGD